jgi:DNA-binding NarL/FixJ family response regulator
MTEPTTAAPVPLRVLVVDADDRIRESLARLLPIGGRCLVVGSAAGTVSALDLAISMSPEVVVIDSRIPDLTADHSFVARLRTVVPGVRIVILTWSEAEEATTRLPGADAYIRKTFRPQELIDAVVNAARRTVA